MAKELDDFQIKHYQIILIACLIGSVMIINSIYVNKTRDLIRLDKEQGVLFNNLIRGRMLSEDSADSQIYSKEVCSRGSESLRKYYETGDLSKIDLEDGEIKCEDKDKGYMQALIKIVRNIAGDGGDDDEEEGGDSGSGGHLRNLASIDKKDIMDYGKRILPMIVFLVFGILSIIGWIICCFCTCCNCCCCCCCKKTKCKIPCFIFTYIFYGLVVGVCVYGLAESNKIFEGLANTECSVLKFFDQVLYGETKQTLPRWAGIRNINELLYDLNSTLTSLSRNAYQELNDSIDNITNLESDFVTSMHDSGEEFYDQANTGNPYKNPYTITLNSDPSGKPDGIYVYDVVYKFGTYDSVNKKYTDDSFLYAWDYEYSEISSRAFGYLNTTRNSFTDILNDSIGDIQGALGDGVEKLDEITGPFKDANDQIGEILSDTSESIDKYGKMGVKLVFGVLMLMNVALAVLMLFICLCSGKCCTSCCLCRCVFKLCTHILWNVLALMMILSFIVGSLISLVGRIGGDAMSLVSFIMSEENFQNNNNPLLLNEIGDAKKYLHRCIQGDGDIAQELGLGDSLDSFEEINSVENNIVSVRDSFTQVIERLETYNRINTLLAGQSSHSEDINMIKFPKNGDLPIKYNELEDSRDSTLKTNIDTIVTYAINSNDIKTSTSAASVKFVIDALKVKYDKYLHSYIEILNFFLDTIGQITNLVRRYSGSGENQSAFAFLNGKFIGTNLKIILKYLKHSLGGDFYTVGICLVVVGFSLILSISSTILLIIIINISLQENIEAEKLNKGNIAVTGVSEYQTNYVTTSHKIKY